MKKKNLPITNIGTVTLLMVFIILCMITLAALSLSSSSRDAEMGEKSAHRITEYYTASNKAEELLAAIDNAFAHAYGNASNDEEYYRMIREELSSADVNANLTEDTLSVDFQVDINDSQALSVLIDVLPRHQVKETDAASFYNILSWQVIRTGTWEGDDSLQLIH